MNNNDQTPNQQTAYTPASETLETLNIIKADTADKNKSILLVAAGVLFLISAFTQIVEAITGLVSLFRYIGSWYATFSTILPSTLMFAGHLAAAAGFALIGLSFFIKKESLQQLIKYAPVFVAGYYAAAAFSQLIYFISWHSGNILLWCFIDIVCCLFWAVLTMIAFDYKPELTEKLSQGYIIIPAVLLAISFMAGVTGFSFLTVLFNTIEHAAVILLGILIYNTQIKTGESNMNEYSSHAYTENRQTSGPAASAVPEPEGFLSIVRLIVLGIVTLGIYLYIWIYRTNEFISKRTPMALQSGSGLQVVLCLFVPFYILYWVYKQCKAIEDYKIRTTGKGGDDLALICLLLSIFGFAIVAYALMQDQINKIVKPVPANNFYTAPQQPNTEASAEANNTAPAAAPESDTVTITDAQIETVKKLKALLDAGILTQEEFEAKKKQVLDL